MTKNDECCPCPDSKGAPSSDSGKSESSDPPDVARIGAAVLTGGFSELIANTFGSSDKK
jgi:hypothetical protein